MICLTRRLLSALEDTLTATRRSSSQEWRCPAAGSGLLKRFLIWSSDRKSTLRPSRRNLRSARMAWGKLFCRCKMEPDVFTCANIILLAALHAGRAMFSTTNLIRLGTTNWAAEGSLHILCKSWLDSVTFASHLLRPIIESLALLRKTSMAS